MPWRPEPAREPGNLGGGNGFGRGGVVLVGGGGGWFKEETNMPTRSPYFDHKPIPLHATHEADSQQPKERPATSLDSILRSHQALFEVVQGHVHLLDARWMAQLRGKTRFRRILFPRGNRRQRRTRGTHSQFEKPAQEGFTAMHMLPSQMNRVCQQAACVGASVTL